MDHLEKRKRVEDALLRDAAPSNREIARSLNVSDGLVRGVRDQLEKAGRISVVERDKGGRRQRERQGLSEPLPPKEENVPFSQSSFLSGITASEHLAPKVPSSQISFFSGTSASEPLAPKGEHVPLTGQHVEEGRSQLQQKVLGLLELGKVTVATLVKIMSVEQLEAIIKEQDKEQAQAKLIRGFKGDYAWLSNSWPAPVKLDDMQFVNVEAAFQAAKTLDLKVRAQIAAVPTPDEAMEMGQRITVRPDWDKVKLSVMENFLRQKFRIPELRLQLFDTFDANLEEDGDCYWGLCDGKGENRLGRLLMKVRESEMLRESFEWRYSVGQGRTEERASGVGQGRTEESAKEEPTIVVTLNKDFMEKNQKPD